LLCGSLWGQWGGGPGGQKVVSSQSLTVKGGTIQVDFAEGSLDLDQARVMRWVSDAADAVVRYYGRFPVARARVLVIPVADSHGIVQGTTWGNIRGFQGFTRMRLGQHTTSQELTDDWEMTHELTHMAFPDLDDDQHWMEEGLATYVEPIARVKAGQIDVKTVWDEMMDGMPKGEPRSGDEGMDRTHTWGRTYWGGALFCLMAEIEIRKQTHNRKGLEDALRAVVEEGGGIDKDWPLERTLAIGDRATGTKVLTGMYARWGREPVEVDLDGIWKELGVRRGTQGVEYEDKAPLAGIRRAMMSR
jgi:hypothetical protein